MKRLRVPVLIMAAGCGAAAAATPPPERGGRGAPAIQPKAEELAQIRAKSEQIEALVKELKAKHADPDLVGDVEVYAKAGRYPARISRSCSATRTRSITRWWCSIRASSARNS